MTVPRRPIHGSLARKKKKRYAMHQCTPSKSALEQHNQSQYLHLMKQKYNDNENEKRHDQWTRRHFKKGKE